jgi:hypothetical protein
MFKSLQTLKGVQTALPSVWIVNCNNLSKIALKASHIKTSSKRVALAS